jgi:membrane protease YdiL (CAAX protease family)
LKSGGPQPNSWAVGDSFNTLLVTYALLLAAGLIHAYVLGATIDATDGIDRTVRKQVLWQMLIVEGIDTVIIAAALWKCRRGYAVDVWRPSQRTRILTWLSALPVLAGLMAINFGYHALLRDWLHIPLVADELMSQFDLLALVVICVQPAFVEEVYFRRLALDTLRGPVSLHGAVWISAVMFGFLHIAVLPSVPYLIVLGAVLGYLRCGSGTLLLPILVHFTHNLTVIVYECLAQ